MEGRRVQVCYELLLGNGPRRPTNPRIEQGIDATKAGILTTRDRVTGDALPSKPTTHSAREVVEAGLAGAVSIGFVVWDHDPFNRANLPIVNENDGKVSRTRRVAHVDDSSRVEICLTLFSTVFCASSEERQAFLGEGEHSVEVQRQHFGPSLVLKIQPESQSLSKRENSNAGPYGIRVELLSPSCSGVIDQDVESLLLGRNLIHEPLNVGELLHIGCDWDAFSRAEGVEFLGGFFAIFGRSG